MNTFENIKVALESIRANLLRSILTLSIIALGLMSLVGILTAIDGLLSTVNDNFNRLGSNSFKVKRKYEEIQSKTQGRTMKSGQVISYFQAMAFKDRLDFHGTKVSVDLFCTGGAQAKYRDKETAENLKLIGVESEYLTVSSYELEAGRNFQINEIQDGSPKCIIGAEIVAKLMNGNAEKALDKVIQINEENYRIIGTIKSKGSTFGTSSDRGVCIPLNNARVQYGSNYSNYNITVAVEDPLLIDDAVSSAIGLMRSIRGLRPIEDNDFKIEKSSSLMTELKDISSSLRMATIAIGLMTLMGAAIGLMNIMLVSVTERTKEIGISKALGATRRNILIQFLTEAIIITLIGGIVGIVLGIVVGNVVTFVLGGSFIFPFAWVALGLVVCIFTGVLSGLYPALKASRLDPIESLRYE